MSLEYGIGGPIVTVAVLSLALNLLFTPVLVYVVNYLVRTAPDSETLEPNTIGGG